jgi:inosine-uridine nucleoside N-ribohydrolase
MRFARLFREPGGRVDLVAMRPHLSHAAMSARLVGRAGYDRFVGGGLGIRQGLSAVLLLIGCEAAGIAGTVPLLGSATAVQGEISAPARTGTGGSNSGAVVVESTAPSVASTPVSSNVPSPRPVSVVVDTDVAPDDLIALALLLASPTVTVAAITITGTGEVRCAAGLRIVFGLLDRLAAPSIPVACGSEVPTAGDHTFPPELTENAERAAGLDLEPSRRVAAPVDATTLLRDTVVDATVPVRLLTIGPLTNVALTLDEHPELASAIESMWIMGGAVDVPGNISWAPGLAANTAAEWNVYIDPSAFDRVLRSGVPIWLISLDGTNQVPVRPEFVDRVENEAGSGPAINVLAELFFENDYMTAGDYYLWDALAALLAAGHDLGRFTPAHLTVETTEEPTSGALRRGDGEANVSYLTDIDADEAEEIILDVLTG